MNVFKWRAVLALSVVATTASAVTGYQWMETSRSERLAAASASQGAAGFASQAIAQAKNQGHLARIKPGLLRELDALGNSGATGVFAHFSSGTVIEQDELIKLAGLTMGYDFRQFTDAVFVHGTVPALLTLARQPSVSYLEQNVSMRYMGETAPWATRVRVAQESVEDGPYTDDSSNILTGMGVGVAVVDSGVNAPHPDLVNNVVKNYKIVCPTPGLINSTTGLCFGGAQFIELGKNASSDTTGGHGTHVAGTVLGDGSASNGVYPVASAAPNQKGTFTGVAPKASLYAYGAGETLVVLSAAEAFDHILKNNDSFTPRVRVVSNSYGQGPDNGVAVEYDPADAFSQLTKRLVESGVSVVFAAGNDGDSTVNDTTSPTCKDPTPGVICVASYDDTGTGSQSGPLSDFTSQGPFTDPTKYPDIAAPGSNITSTCSELEPGQAVCATGAETRWLPYYGTISGTSMATPHVSGAIALLYQARPSLTPAEVELALQNSALKLKDPVYDGISPTRSAYVADPQNPAGTTNYRAGAGLLNMTALLKAQNVAHGSLPASGERFVADGDTETSITGAADIVSLSLTEVEQGGAQGISYALTVRDATAFGTPAASKVRFLIDSNVGGQHFTSGADLTSEGLVTPLARGPVANAAATAASVSGNVLRIFVPLGNLGGPAIGTPIHNIVAQSLITTSSGETVADYAPSSSAIATVAAAQPTFGKPYTVLSASQPVAEDICTPPGATILTDGSGDILLPTGVSTLTSYDIQSLSLAQPYYSNGDYKLVFTLKMSSLNPMPPDTTWPINFCSPGFTTCTGASAYSATNKYYTVRMTTDPTLKLSPSVGAEFQILQPSSTGTTRTTKLAEAESTSNADGTITIVVKGSDIGLTASAAGSAAQTLSSFLTRVTNSAGLTPDNMPDAATQGAGSYSTRPLAFCAPNTPPLALLAATPVSGSKPLNVAFDGTASSDTDAGDSIANYQFDFGDGSAFVSNTSGTASHTYTRSGTFQAVLEVTDTKGAKNTSTATQTITVSNAAPVAALTSDVQSGAAPLTVSFDASGSTDANPGDADALLYNFDLDGDGTFEIEDSASAKPSFTYETVGRYTAVVKVKDSEGAVSSNTAERVIDVLAESAGNADAFSFVERSNVPVNTFVQSESVTMSGYTGTLPISVDSGLQYSIDGGAFTNTAGTIASGAKLSVRHVSAETENTAKENTVTVGSRSAVFRSVTTTVDRVPDAFDFGTKSNQAPNTVVESDPRVLENFDEAVIVAGPGIAYRIDNGEWTSSQGKLIVGQSLTVRHTTSSSSLGYTKTYLKVGGVKGYFTTRTQK